MKETLPSRPRKTVAKPVQAARSGGLSRPETTALLMSAQEAFHYQTALGRIEPGSRFDDWRRDQVMAAVERPGISKIDRSQWRTVAAHFAALAGREDEALRLLSSTGVKAYRPSNDADTWETAETCVALMSQAIEAHGLVAVDHPKGHLTTGWLIAAARQRTGKPTLSMATMAERLDPQTLAGLLSHLRNHIALREGRETDRRSKRVYSKPADPGSMHEDADPF
jgi:hypothetical protein